MITQVEVKQLSASLKEADHIQSELDRRIFYLKTLYDVSKDIYSSIETDSILRNFLLMSMGNFGVMEAFVLLMDMPAKGITHFVPIGFDDTKYAALKKSGMKYLLHETYQGVSANGPALKRLRMFPPSVEYVLPFSVETDYLGFLGMGSKMVGDPYNENDKELLDTLLNNLVVALKNARSFEEIKQLNKDLQDKNVQLETALGHLSASMRKVEILESVKENLCKFVPVSVSRMIEKSPTGAIPKRKRQDLSVLFLDIEGYTKLCEKLGSSETSEIIEKHFSVFMDAIYTNNGDVNETAGDGLMVLFLNEDEETNALEAVRTALSVREETVRICKECPALYRPLDINIGINSGQALVGAAKFDTYSGSRWTYTARGRLTNVAARIGSQASGGSIYLSRTTADRVNEHFSPFTKGKFKLKNVSEEVEIFEL
jgi:class 3 adenylate cyclase